MITTMRDCLHKHQINIDSQKRTHNLPDDVFGFAGKICLLHSCDKHLFTYGLNFSNFARTDATRREHLTLSSDFAHFHVKMGFYHSHHKYLYIYVLKRVYETHSISPCELSIIDFLLTVVLWRHSGLTVVQRLTTH